MRLYASELELVVVVYRLGITLIGCHDTPEDS
jgi:hypothetical protein